MAGSAAHQGEAEEGNRAGSGDHVERDVVDIEFLAADGERRRDAVETEHRRIEGIPGQGDVDPARLAGRSAAKSKRMIASPLIDRLAAPPP